MFQKIKVLLIAIIAIQSLAAQESRPNILMILCDDLGYADVGFNGSKDIITPNIDQLANNGTKFTSAYVTHPFCGPSRAGLMAGRYPHRFGSQFNLPHDSDDTSQGVPVEEIFISKTLQDAGYYTGAIGKWHLGEEDRFHPNARGFDDFYGFLAGGHDYFPKEYQPKYDRLIKNKAKHIREYLKPLQHNGKDIQQDEYITDAFSKHAVKFIGDAAKKDNPFFLYLAYNAPHTPIQAKKEDIAKFPNIKDKQRQTYAAMVYAVDRGVKQIVDQLKATNQYDNTLIVFLSDNGGKLKRGGNNFPLREGKGSTCEGGFRVPMFFHYPNVIAKNNTFNHPVSALDFYPTFTHLAKGNIPAAQKTEGQNIWSKVLNNEETHKGETIVAFRHRQSYTDVGGRKGKWKALRLNKEWFLYDIDNDISETNDLSDQYPKILDDIKCDIKKWTKKNVAPKWFHAKPAETHFKANNMPKIKDIFSN